MNKIYLPYKTRISKEDEAMPSVFYEQRMENLFIGPICDHPFPAHVHEPVEIVCITQGEMNMMIAGKTYQVCRGDIIIAFPTVTHSYEYVSPDADGLTLIFQPDTIGEFSSTFRTSQPVCPVLKISERPSELDGLISKMKEVSKLESSPLKLGCLHLFLAYLLSSLTLKPITDRLQFGLYHQALHYISEHFTEPLSLESTAFTFHTSSLSSCISISATISTLCASTAPAPCFVIHSIPFHRSHICAATEIRVPFTGLFYSSAACRPTASARCFGSKRSPNKRLQQQMADQISGGAALLFMPPMRPLKESVLLFEVKNLSSTLIM